MVFPSASAEAGVTPLSTVHQLASVAVSPPGSFTVHGGEPAWSMYRLDADQLQAGRHPDGNYVNELLFPWARVLIRLRLDANGERPIIDSIRSEPATSGPRVLPSTATIMDLTVPDDRGRILASGHGSATGDIGASAVLSLLSDQKPVAGADACAGPAQQTARLTLDDTTVVISLGDHCQEAVSSEGGRVSISNATFSSLKPLFRIHR
jgi:hypothetical protein